jgi:hypothetical protein
MENIWQPSGQLESGHCHLRSLAGNKLIIPVQEEFG